MNVFCIVLGSTNKILFKLITAIFVVEPVLKDLKAYVFVNALKKY